MKRTRMVLAGLMAALVVGAAGAGSASAGFVDMNFKVRVMSEPVIDCDARAVTINGPPPAATRIDGSSMYGSCLPDVLVVNNPEVTFTGGAVWTASIDRLKLSDGASGCSWVATNMPLNGSTNLTDPFSGASFVAPSPWICPNYLEITGMTFS